MFIYLIKRGLALDDFHGFPFPRFWGEGWEAGRGTERGPRRLGSRPGAHASSKVGRLSRAAVLQRARDRFVFLREPLSAQPARALQVNPLPHARALGQSISSEATLATVAARAHKPTHTLRGPAEDGQRMAW